MLRPDRWDSREKLVAARDATLVAIERERLSSVARADAARSDAVRRAAQEHAARLAAARRAAEAASGAVASADLARRTAASMRALAEGSRALAATPSILSAPAGAGPFGLVRIGRLPLGEPPAPTSRVFGPTSLADVPAFLSLSGRNLVVEGAVGRVDDVVKSVVLRALLGCPAGDLRLTLIDPRGSGQGLAGFLDLPAPLRGDKVLVGSDEIEAQLRTLNGVIETVIQVRLGSRHETLDAYNRANPAVAEPHRLVAVQGLPTGGWTERGLDLLARIFRNGPRAGVHAIVGLDRSSTPPYGVVLESILAPAARAVVLDGESATLTVAGEPALSFVPEMLPHGAAFEALLADVAEAFSRRSRALPARGILPAGDWDGDSTDGVVAPIGLDADGDVLRLSVGDDPAHGLIGGMTGMGKSNLLHMIVIGLASRYSPDELELDLLDFREGVGFAPYRRLPHARAVALETEREFALSVVRGLQGEISRRGRLFSSAGVDQFPAYRRGGNRLPRRILLIDEFQVLLAGDDQVARDAAQVLEDLVKRGRGFGIHVLLSSQSPSVAGPYLSRIYNQMGLRIALRCQKADALAILGEGNDVAYRLEEPGEAIVNQELGLVAGNRRVRIALLGRDEVEERVRELSEADAGRHSPPVTFEGAAAARIEANPTIADLRAGAGLAQPGIVELFLGEPVEVKGPTSVSIERYPRANLLIAGPDEVAAYGLMASAIISAALGQPNAQFRIVDFARPSASVAGVLQGLARRLDGRAAASGPREAQQILDEIESMLRERSADASDAPPVFFVVAGLHRWRELRGTTAYDTTDGSASLLRILDEGPELGLHTIAWTDGAATLDRALKRNAVSSFDLRAVLRVPDSDSMNLIDSQAAGRLADNRALLRNEEDPSGRFEKFKPYPVPSEGVMDDFLGHRP